MANELPRTDPSTSETGCCPRFQPEPWESGTFFLDRMLFAKVSTRNFMHMPLNMGKVMTAAMKTIRQAGAELPDDYLILSKDLSPWRSDHYFRIAKEIPGLAMERLTGTFLTKVYEGPFQQMPLWIKDMEAFVSSQGKKADDYFAFYTTCPKCAKVYGKNYVVLFAKVQ
jgi:hypothetical protein